MALIWHGGSRWDSDPEVRPARKGRAEWGPGIYGTSSYFRAKSYAKGGKVTQLVDFVPSRWLNEVALGLDTVNAFVRANAPRAKAEDIMSILTDRTARISTDRHEKLGDGDRFIPAVNLLNMWVNTGLSTGVRGPVLAEFFSELGIDAHSERMGSNGGEDEYWTVIFNPDCIEHYEVIPAKEVDSDQWNLGSPLDQQNEETVRQRRSMAF